MDYPRVMKKVKNDLIKFLQNENKSTADIDNFMNLYD